MAVITTPNDIITRWVSDDTIPATDLQLALYIKDVEGQIVAHFPHFYENITSGKLIKANAVASIAWIIIEFLQTKGSPYSSVSQSVVGTASSSVAFSSSNGRYSLRLTAADFDSFSTGEAGVIGGFNFVKRLNRSRFGWC